MIHPARAGAATLEEAGGTRFEWPTEETPMKPSLPCSKLVSHVLAASTFVACLAGAASAPAAEVPWDYTWTATELPDAQGFWKSHSVGVTKTKLGTHLGKPAFLISREDGTSDNEFQWRSPSGSKLPWNPGEACTFEIEYADGEFQKTNDDYHGDFRVYDAKGGTSFGLSFKGNSLLFLGKVGKSVKQSTEGWHTYRIIYRGTPDKPVDVFVDGDPQPVLSELPFDYTTTAHSTHIQFGVDGKGSPGACAWHRVSMVQGERPPVAAKKP